MQFTRLDRHVWYIWACVGIWFVGVGLVLAPVTTGALGKMDLEFQTLLAFSMVTGAFVSLIGTSLGGRKVNYDKRKSYRLGIGGMICIGISMANYGWIIWQHSNLVGTFAGGLTIAFAGASFNMALVFYLEIRRITKNIPKVKDAVLAMLEVEKPNAE